MHIAQILASSLPVLYLACSTLVFAVALHCSNHQHRLRLLPVFLLFNLLAFTSTRNLFYNNVFANLWRQYLAFYTIHITSLLYLERWPAPPRPAGKSGPYLDWRATYKLWGNPQLLSRIPSVDSGLPHKSQSRSAFIFLRLAKLPIYYYLYEHIAPAIFSNTLVNILPSDVSPIQQSLFHRLGEVTSREVAIRSYISTLWIWKSVIFLDGTNAILASFFVLVGLDNPEDWPALFGPPTSATSLRRFWSTTWHRLGTRPYSNYAKFLLHGLGLPRKSFWFKAAIAFLVFAMSGAEHSLVSWQAGRPHWWSDTWWFILNSFACTAEVMVLNTIRSCAKKMNCSRQLQEVERSWLASLVGYVWVFGFFFWSTPVWAYPGAYKSALEREKWERIASGISFPTE